MNSYYEINVARNGKHFFATDPRSFTNEQAVMEALAVFYQKFLPSEGYDVTVTYWNCVGDVKTYPILRHRVEARAK